MDVTSRAVAPASRVFVVVFVVIAALGAFVAWRGVEIARTAGTGPQGAFGPLMLGGVLLGVGVAGALFVWRGGSRSAVRDRLRAAHPGEPWNWRPEWAAGRIPGGGRSGAITLLVGALVWNGFTWPVAGLFLSREIEDPNLYLVLLFPGAGVLLAGLAVRALLQARRHGTSYFVPDTRPGVIGRTLQGHVETTLQDAPAEGVEVRLQCDRLRRTRAVGSRTQTRHHRTTLWNDVVSVEAPELTRGVAGMRVPVAFEIPSNLPPADDRNPDEGVLWTLSISAAVPGLDYADTFDVPVFATGDPPLSDAERDALRSNRRARARAHVPSTPLYRVESTGRGRLFAFTPRTSAGSAVGAVAATAAGWAGAWWLWDRGISIGAGLVAFIALLLTVGTVVALFHRSSVEIAGGTITLRHRVLGLGTTRRLEARRVTDVRARVVGEGNAQSWEVEVHTSDGGPYSAAAHFISQRDADFVAEQLRAAITGAR